MEKGKKKIHNIETEYPLLVKWVPSKFIHYIIITDTLLFKKQI